MSREKIADARKNFTEVLKRLKSVANVRFDYEAGALMGFSRSKFATMKSRGQVPKTAIELWALRNGKSSDWILHQEAPQETVADAMPAAQKPLFHEPDPSDLRTLINQTMKVLGSGADNPFMRALSSNIEAFALAVDLEQRVRVLESLVLHPTDKGVAEPTVTSQQDQQPSGAPADGKSSHTTPNAGHPTGKANTETSKKVS